MRKPLAGHPYHRKSYAELHFIIKDANQAALNMRDYDIGAEAKYLDQINDACTVLNYRANGGRREYDHAEGVAFYQGE